MNDYTAAIAQLDQKMYRPVTVEDWKRIADKPAATLTDDDITICGYFGGPKSAAAARARREKALAPPDPPVPVTKATAAPSDYVTHHALMKQFEGYTAALIDVLKAQKARIDAQANEIAALKARPLQKWAGIHIDGAPYAEASLVTKGGSLWVATTATTTTPGEAGGDWRLIVKRGHA